MTSSKLEMLMKLISFETTKYSVITRKQYSLNYVKKEK